MLSFNEIDKLVTYLMEELELKTDKEEFATGIVSSRRELTATQMLHLYMQSKIIDWQLINLKEPQAANPEIPAPFQPKIK